MSDMVERVAREIAAVDGDDGDSEVWHDYARAAIAVMWDVIKEGGLLSPDLDNAFDAALGIGKD